MNPRLDHRGLPQGVRRGIRRALGLVLALLATITVFVAGREPGHRAGGTTPTAEETAEQPMADALRSRDSQPPSRSSRGPIPSLPQPREAPLAPGTDSAGDDLGSLGSLGPGEAPADTGDGNVDRLRGNLKDALAAARADAEREGIEILVNSGFRSAEHQAELFRQAVAKYGSPERARKWVLPPEESNHVTGDAIDVGPAAAAAWLEEHGARYMLCRTYANEPWHFEVRPLTPRGTCPPMLPHA